MKLGFITVSIFTFLLFSIPLFSQYEPVTEFDPERDPFADLEDAIAEAEQTGQRIILDVGGNWCIWCKRLDAFIRENEEIDSLMHSEFIVLKVNMSKENDNAGFLSQYPEIPGYPHLFVLDSDGAFLHSQNTALLEENKSYSVEKLQSFLDTWKPTTD